jgi:hypothetical protein
MMAIQELVVPRSIPKTFDAVAITFLSVEKSKVMPEGKQGVCPNFGYAVRCF